MTAASESIINRINKLLALAMDASASEHERALAQERAEKLMVQHQLDRMDLTVEDKSKIIEVDWEFPGLERNWSSYLWQLAEVIIRHCNCKAILASRGYGSDRTMRAKVVGFPEDINYVQHIWPVVFMELANNLFPKWDSNETLDANVYRFVKAGYKWREIHEIAYRHGAEGVPNPYPPERSYANERYQDTMYDFSYGYRLRVLDYVPEKGMLGRAYRRECLKIDGIVKRSASRKVAYKASYFQSFNSTIARRLRDMRKKASEQIDEADRYRLALIDTEEQVLAEFYRLHPEYDPESDYNKQRAAEAQERRRKMTPEEIEAEQRRQEKAWKRYQKMRDSEYDPSGWAHGTQVAEKVDLSFNAKVKQEKKELS